MIYNIWTIYNVLDEDILCQTKPLLNIKLYNLLQAYVNVILFDTYSVRKKWVCYTLK